MAAARMTIRRWMIAVAIVAILCWVIVGARYDGGSGLVAVGCGLFGLGAMRHPLIFMGLAIVLCLAGPTYFDSGALVFYKECFVLAWFLGAGAGTSVRMVRERTGPPSRSRPGARD